MQTSATYTTPVWHPCMQMKDFAVIPPLHIVAAQGAELIDREGRRIIDAISSWWCKSLGHQHPRLMAAIARQCQQFEHVMLGNTTNDAIITLSEKLCALTTHCRHVFYASEGSSAVEIALKMSVHVQQLRGQPQRQRIAALSHGYHGETGLALSASDCGEYRTAYESLLIPMIFLRDLPYVTGPQDPLWHDCASYWPAIEKQLENHAKSLAAMIIEPLLQGAGGMKIYSADFLKRLRRWCDDHQVLLIADEILTGIGRTGKTFACEHAGVAADIICLAKGLTAGVLPLSAVLTTPDIYQYFYADYDQHKAFLHSHTHSGNALAVAVALEVLAVMEEENLIQRATLLQSTLHDRMQAVAHATQRLVQVRAFGGMAAAELVGEPGAPARLGFRVYQEALSLGALLRPLGNTLYWLPPLNVDGATLDRLQDITLRAIQQAW